MFNNWIIGRQDRFLEDYTEEELAYKALSPLRNLGSCVNIVCDTFPSDILPKVLEVIGLPVARPGLSNEVSSQAMLV